MRTALTCIMLALPARASAQLPVIESGSTVRVVSTSGDRLFGTLRAQTPDSVVVTARNGRDRRIAVSRISSIDRSAGRTPERGALNGVRFGAAAGLGVFAVSIGAHALFSGLLCDDCTEPLTRGEVARGLGGGVLVGALIGAGVGYALGAHEWERVFSARSSPRLRALRSGDVGLGVSVAF